MRILVTGAECKTGETVIRHLQAQGADVVGLASPDAAGKPLVNAMQGVRRVYHICPISQGDELAVAETVIAAAQTADVELFAYHSVLAPHLEEISFHWTKMQAHMALTRCGLPFSVIQPACYMQNLCDALSGDALCLPYDIAARQSWVDLEDVGAAVAALMTRPAQRGGIYELCGTTAPLSGTEIAASLSSTLGRVITAQYRPPVGAPNDLMDWYGFLDHYGFTAGNTRVLTDILGREPNKLSDWAAREFAA